MNSNTEYEGRILNVNTKECARVLDKLGAKKIAHYDYKRYTFDTIPKVSGKWVRLRDNGKEVTLTVKETTSETIDGTKEWEVDVSDLEKTLNILEKIGISPKSYQENSREEYLYRNAHISIDTWPRLNPFIEIEADSVAKVEDIAKDLGFSKKDITGDGVMVIYAKKGMDLDAIPELKF